MKKVITEYFPDYDQETLGIEAQLKGSWYYIIKYN